MSKKVLLSTDIGFDIDDALSLLFTLNSGIDLKGVYTVNEDIKSELNRFDYQKLFLK